jgi:two-component system invasion response regulator UvrY
LADGDTQPLLQVIFEGYPDTRVLVSSAEPAHLYEQSLYLRFGFLYLSKAAQGPETINMMTSFLNNSRPPEMNFKHNGKTPFSELSIREKQVARWLVRNWSPAQIGEKLKISPATVRVQKKIILEKTRTKNIQELKKLANIHQV